MSLGNNSSDKTTSLDWWRLALEQLPGEAYTCTSTTHPPFCSEPSARMHFKLNSLVRLEWEGRLAPNNTRILMASLLMKSEDGKENNDTITTLPCERSPDVVSAPLENGNSTSTIKGDCLLKLNVSNPGLYALTLGPGVSPLSSASAPLMIHSTEDFNSNLSAPLPPVNNSNSNTGIGLTGLIIGLLIGGSLLLLLIWLWMMYSTRGFSLKTWWRNARNSSGGRNRTSSEGFEYLMDDDYYSFAAEDEVIELN